MGLSIAEAKAEAEAEEAEAEAEAEAETRKNVWRPNYTKIGFSLRWKTANPKIITCVKTLHHPVSKYTHGCDNCPNHIVTTPFNKISLLFQQWRNISICQRETKTITALHNFAKSMVICISLLWTQMNDKICSVSPWRLNTSRCGQQIYNIISNHNRTLAQKCFGCFLC